MNLVSSSRMREIDRISIEQKGFGDLILMENAGIRLLEEAEKHTGFSADTRVVCAAGRGNNGGDVLVIARQIFSRHDSEPVVVIFDANGTDAYNFNLNLSRSLGIRIIHAEEDPQAAEHIIAEADIIFDGLSGTGIKGGLRSPLKEAAELINGSDALIFAIDVPSGTGEGYVSEFPAVKADFTLTVGLPKRCLYLPAVRPFCGKIITVPIGFPEDLKNAEGLEPDGRNWMIRSTDDIDLLMPELSPGDYKNSRGHVGILAGSTGTTGAASLCAEAAIHSPAGLVSLFADSDTYAVLAARHRAVMVKRLDGSSGRGSSGAAAAAAAAAAACAAGAAGQMPELSGFKAMAVGPGWGTEGRDGTLEAALKAGRGVLDADGINVLAGMVSRSGKYPDLGGRWLLTPHAGEFRRLFPGADPLAAPYSAVPAASEQLNAVILLKGAVSFIAAPDGRAAVIDGVCPKLGTAGSGDVLCGLAAGYMTAIDDPFEAAVLAALVHLRAGRRCAEALSWFSADDLLNYL